jgi:hypothetical protein
MKTLLLAALISTGPFVTLDDYVYHDDPCVEVLRAAMEHMELFIPQHFKKDGEFWAEYVQLTEADMTERDFAGELWKDAKLQCYRH